MKRFFKILIAVILVGIIIFFGVRYYIEEKDKKISENEKIMDALVKTTEEENENEKKVYEDITDENKLSKIEEYISRIFLEFPGGEPLPEFSDVKCLSEEYITHLAYLNSDLIQKENVEGEKVYLSYPELNRVIVSLLGLDAHNMFPNKTNSYFIKSTKGFEALPMDGSESIENDYVIDKIRLCNDGLYYVDMYEFTKEYEVINVDATIEDSGKKLNILDVNGNYVFDYTLEVIPYSEFSLSYKYLDAEGNEMNVDTIREDVKENLDKFVKRTIVLEYDEELDLYYMKSNNIEN